MGTKFNLVPVLVPVSLGMEQNFMVTYGSVDFQRAYK